MIYEKKIVFTKYGQYSAGVHEKRKYYDIEETKEPVEYVSDEGCLMLMARIIKSCENNQTAERRKINRDFTKKKAIDIFCDCSDGWDAEKLRKKILNYNNEKLWQT